MSCTRCSQLEAKLVKIASEAGGALSLMQVQPKLSVFGEVEGTFSKSPGMVKIKDIFHSLKVKFANREYGDLRSYNIPSPYYKIIPHTGMPTISRDTITIEDQIMIVFKQMEEYCNMMNDQLVDGRFLEQYIGIIFNMKNYFGDNGAIRRLGPANYYWDQLESLFQKLGKLFEATLELYNLDTVGHRYDRLKGFIKHSERLNDPQVIIPGLTKFKDETYEYLTIENKRKDCIMFRDSDDKYKVFRKLKQIVDEFGAPRRSYFD